MQLSSRCNTCHHPSRYPAKPSYSHFVKLGRTDDHFSTAARVKKTVTPPTDKTVTVLALVSWRALVITVEPSPLKHGGQFVRALRCHQGTFPASNHYDSLLATPFDIKC